MVPHNRATDITTGPTWPEPTNCAQQLHWPPASTLQCTAACCPLGLQCTALASCHCTQQCPALATGRYALHVHSVDRLALCTQLCILLAGPPWGLKWGNYKGSAGGFPKGFLASNSTS
ncbi:hypothetical protein MRB53_006396 [Persea americana]|uniref:Uncharacterized protein n=1 Tax=Persea americana TaxID=3435 RepID=A0ACC2MGA7_PERAE|nr:hypothetical protein MRB53_006396 [Persea americana]